MWFIAKLRLVMCGMKVISNLVVFRYYFDLKLIIKLNGLGRNRIRVYNIVSYCICINLFFQNNYQSSRGRAPKKSKFEILKEYSILEGC